MAPLWKVVSWNVRRLGRAHWEAWLPQLDASVTWDVVCLQEAHQESTLSSWILPGGHVAHLIPDGGQWAPAIIVHRNWAVAVTDVRADSGVGAVYVQAESLWCFISAHLPHNWAPNSPERDLREESWELRMDAVARLWRRDYTIMG
eukprot:11713699-Alexandrium_andersonii.AAC.1